MPLFLGLVRTGKLQEIPSAQKCSCLLESSHLTWQSVGEGGLTVKEHLHQDSSSSTHLYLVL